MASGYLLTRQSRVNIHQKPLTPRRLIVLMCTKTGDNKAHKDEFNPFIPTMITIFSILLVSTKKNVLRKVGRIWRLMLKGWKGFILEPCKYTGH